MADPIVKFPSDKTAKETPTSPPPRLGWKRMAHKYRRPLLLVVAPLVVLIVGASVYLTGGRYVSTDDAYVGAQKVLVTPDISGKIDKVVVREGQRVNAGDVLFEIDPAPFRLAVQQAKANLDQAKTTYDNLQANIKAYGQMIELAQRGIELKQHDVDRKTSLIRSNSGSQLDLDTSVTALVTAQAQLQLIKQQVSTARNQLLGNPDLPVAEFPPYAQAQAALDEAKRNLDHATIRAPIGGVATQVDQIQLGRFVAPGTPLFSIIDTSAPWVDANLKESDFGHITTGQPVSITVDAFPDHVFRGTIGSLSPGTGAQFAILPPQNATGNFVKIVQRVSVRIYFDANDGTVQKLKAGMSSYVSIDTGHRRSLSSLVGIASAEQKTP